MRLSLASAASVIARSKTHVVDEPSVLATVPMWFGLPMSAKPDAMITQLADLDHKRTGHADYFGHSATIRGGGYHFLLWPLFTGWAAVGEYRYHRSFSCLREFPSERSAGLLMARLGTSRKCSRVPITNRLPRARRIRSGPRQWWSAQCSAPCSGCGRRNKGNSHFRTERTRRLDFLRNRNVQWGPRGWICIIPRTLENQAGSKGHGERVPRHRFSTGGELARESSGRVNSTASPCRFVPFEWDRTNTC